MLRMLAALAVLILGVSIGTAADKPTKVRWYGQSLIQIETAAGKKIVFDPHAIPVFGAEKPDADLVCISHEHDDHNLTIILPKNEKRLELHGLKPANKAKTVFEWNKIDQKIEALGVQVKTFGTYHDEKDGKERGLNSIFVVTVDGLTFCHLGDLGHELSPQLVKQIGKVDVLFVPVGGIYTINGEVARKVTAAINPRLFAIPMHYAVEGYDDLLSPAEFLEEQKNVKKMEDTNELSVSADMKPDGGYTVAVLGYKKAEPKKDK